MEKIPMTAAGYAALEAEIKHLKATERPAVIKLISEARSHGDLSEASSRAASWNSRTSSRAPR
jgi:transcription elongation factor GreA